MISALFHQEFKIRLVVLNFIFFLTIPQLQAQDSVVSSSVNRVSKEIVYLLNNEQLDNAYALFSKAFGSEISANDFKRFMKEDFQQHLPFTQCILLASQGNLFKFKLIGKDTLSMYLGLTQGDEVKTLYIEPFRKHKDLYLTESIAVRRDSVARKVLGFINDEKIDSIYLYLGDSLKALGLYKWNILLKDYFFVKTPAVFAQMIDCKKNKNEYQIGNYLFSIEFDQYDKIEDLQLELDTKSLADNESVSTDNSSHAFWRPM